MLCSSLPHDLCHRPSPQPLWGPPLTPSAVEASNQLQYERVRPRLSNTFQPPFCGILCHTGPTTRQFRRHLAACPIACMHGIWSHQCRPMRQRVPSQQATHFLYWGRFGAQQNISLMAHSPTSPSAVGAWHCSEIKASKSIIWRVPSVGKHGHLLPIFTSDSLRVSGLAGTAFMFRILILGVVPSRLLLLRESPGGSH
jgi:hypothetical protein